MREIAVHVLDAESAAPVSSPMVKVRDERARVVLEARPTANGTCWLKADTAHTVEVSAAGYQPKSYVSVDTPQTVRLLKVSPFLFLDRPSARPGEEVTAYYSAPNGGSVRLLDGQGEATDALVLADVVPATGLVPDEDLVATGLEWPHFSFIVPSVSTGLWSLELRMGDDRALAPLIVRTQGDQDRQPRVLVLASVATWMCYNHWGGRNRYRNSENEHSNEPDGGLRLRARQVVSRTLARLVTEVPRTKIKRALGRDSTPTSWVSRPLSWSRPWGKSTGLAVAPDEPTLNHLAALDRKILAWLDVQGIDYECVADLDLHRDAEICHERDAIVLLGHSEYWSTKMFDRLLKAHRERGAWVINFSGNSIYREIEVADDFSVRLSNIVMALSGRDETALTGVRYSERGYATAAPFVAMRPEHWIFASTSLRRRERFGSECLIANGQPAEHGYNPSHPTTATGELDGRGAAGFEVDRRPRSRRNEFTIVARGDRPGSAHMVVKEPMGKSGGSFSASSITFGGALLVDKTCSTIALNVLRKASPASIPLPASSQD